MGYKAYPKQNIFHGSATDETVYGGAKGGGKSLALVMDAVAYAVKFEKAKIYLFRKTYDELEATLINELKENVPEITKHNPNGIYRYDQQRHIAIFPNGSRIFFRFVANKADAEKYAGREMDYLGVDELTQHKEEVIQILMSCVRSPKGYPARFKGTCNPGGVGHRWVKKRYITSTKYGQNIVVDPKTGNTIQFIPATVYDNEALMKNDPKYEKRLRNLPPTLRKAFLEGNWDIFEGQAFEEWDYSIHVCKSFDIPPHWRRWRSCDNGYTDPFAFYWLALDEDGRIHIYREYTRNYGDNKVIYSSQARKVISLSQYRVMKKDGTYEKYPEKIDFTIAGHDAFAVQPATRTEQKPEGKCINDYYVEGGLKDCVRAITDRKYRAAVWHEYLTPYIDQNDGKKKAKVVIHDCCEMLIETLPQQITDEKDSEKVALTDYDHWYDGAGYGLLAFHAERTKKPKGEESQLEKHKKAKVRANKRKRF